MINIAYSGTQQGMNEAQMLALRGLIPDGARFHHGDCIGGDSQAHLLAIKASCEIYIHPCTIEDKRAYNSGAYRVYLARSPLLRNRVMVEATDWLIATPFQDNEVLRSGTWSTIRYAQRYRRLFHSVHRITHIKRNGTVCEL